MKDRIDAILRRNQAEYLETLLPPRDALLEHIEKFADENDHPIADPEVAQLMRVMVRTKRPRRVLEVGTNIGYFNPSSATATVTLTARRSSDGAVLGTNTITIAGFSMVQQPAFSAISSVPEADRTQNDYYVSWISNAPVFVYGAVTDNKTGDAVLNQ